MGTDGVVRVRKSSEVLRPDRRRDLQRNFPFCQPTTLLSLSTTIELIKLAVLEAKRNLLVYIKLQHHVCIRFPGISDARVREPTYAGALHAARMSRVFSPPHSPKHMSYASRHRIPGHYQALFPVYARPIKTVFRFLCRPISFSYPTNPCIRLRRKTDLSLQLIPCPMTPLYHNAAETSTRLERVSVVLRSSYARDRRRVRP
jgi:hypothetical protein